MDTPSDPRFDRLIQLTVRLFNVPIALVSLVDGERQWFKAAIGFAQGGGTLRDDAFCAYTVLDPTAPLIVEDATRDARFARNPLVTGPQAIRFYAGAPVLDAEGRALGSLCLLDTKPRHLSPQDIATLKDLAFSVSTIIGMEQAIVAQRESEEHHRWAVALSPQTQWVADAEGNVLEVGPRMLRQFGMTLKAAHGFGWMRGVPADERAVVEETWRHSLSTGARLDLEFRFHMPDGSWRWVRSRAAPRRDEAGRIIRWYGTIEDIDDRKQAELAREDGQRRLEGVLESTTDLVAFFDHDWRATYLNQGVRCFEGWANLLGNVLWDVHTDLVGTEIERQFLHAKRSGSPVTFEWCSKRMGGWIEIHAYPTAQGFSVFMRDVTEQHRLRGTLIHQAQHDPLTSLPNATLLRTELQERLKRYEGDRTSQALLRLRLDSFRSATDTFGPAMGDALMLSLAERLRPFAAAGSFVARVDGPEFAVLHSCGPHDKAPEALARELFDVLRHPYSLNGSTIRLEPHIGIAHAPEDATDVDQLLQAAGIAMSHVWSNGRPDCRRFTPSMLQDLERTHRLVLDLRHAVERQELWLAYQPLVDFPQGRIGGFEALIRWSHPERGLVPPAEFIPVAEQSGLILEIGAWALRRACEDAKNWREPLRVAVNLSPVQFRDPDLVATVVRVLEETGLPASRLKLEITETVLLEDCESNLALLHQLKALGVMIVLDDFGTGYSSLGYLQRFPFHKLKIDQSFIRPLMQQAGSRAIVRSILDLAKALNIGTTAEGVETEEQLQWLIHEGCDQVQGFGLGRPMPTAETDAFVSDFRLIGSP